MASDDGAGRFSRVAGWSWPRKVMLVASALYLALAAIALAGVCYCCFVGVQYALGMLHDTQSGFGAESVSVWFVGFLAGVSLLACGLPGALGLLVAARRSWGALAVGFAFAVGAGAWFSLLSQPASVGSDVEAAWVALRQFGMLGVAGMYGVMGLLVMEVDGG